MRSQNHRITEAQNHGSTESQNHFAMIVSAFLCFCVSLFLFAFPALAQVDAGLEPLTATGLGTTDIRVIVANIIRVFLGLLGVIGIVLVLYGGFLWMTSAGNEEKVTKAKKLLLNAGIGLAIVLSAYGITAFIIRGLLGASEGGVITDVGREYERDRGGALGGGIIQDHYPGRYATGIPRGAKITVTFKERMQVDTIVTSAGEANLENVRLAKTIANSPRTADDLVAMTVTPSADGKMFLFAPKTLLGSPSEPISYTMRFEKGLKKANGDAAFGRFETPYYWQFEVSTIIDTEPPTVVSVIPVKDAAYPRNVVIQATFSEPIDPTVVSGDEKTSKVTVYDSANRRIAGTIVIANQYQTIEFITNDLCGKNSCGNDVYCLPASATVTVRLPSARLTDDTEDSPFAALIPYTGIVDLSGNALDGNTVKDAQGKPIADGPGAPPAKDDVVWSFTTTDKIDLTPPKIEALTPTPGKDKVSPDEPLRVKFSKPMLFSTFQSPNVLLEPIVNYRAGKEKDDVPGNDKIGIITHDPFERNTAYTPTITAGVKDAFQNCYFPCSGPGCTGRTWQGYPSCVLP